MTSSDLSDETFQYMAFKDIELSGLPVQASRFSYTGTQKFSVFCNLKSGQASAEIHEVTEQRHSYVKSAKLIFNRA